MTRGPFDFTGLARRLQLGQWYYRLWHQPRAAVARSRREGGPWQQWLDARGRRAMAEAAHHLAPIRSEGGKSREVVFLTGRKFWYQTAFCCWSLQRHADVALRPVFVDDGTFDVELIAESQRLFPGAQVELRADIERRLDQFLPRDRYPALRHQRETYIHLRKVTDVHTGQHGWRLVLDSDMLFFRRPGALLDWLASPAQPIHMLDVMDSYGYPLETLAELAGRPIPPHLNVGICGLPSDQLDWNQLESWCAELLQRHGSSYYLEQALVALCLSHYQTVQLSATEYRLMPEYAECESPRAVMHHYVDTSKRGYFRIAWRQALAAAGALSSA